MQWTYVSFAAGAAGVAAAAVAAPVLAPDLARLWSSARTAAPMASSGPAVTRPEPVEPPPREPAPAQIVAPPERPAFDVVRVDRAGEAVIAGHATPNAKVELRDGGRVVAEIDSGASGQFVILPPPLAAGGHRLELAARAGGGPAVLSDALSIDAGIQPPALAGAPLPVPPAPAAAEARDTAVVPAPAPVEARGSDASPKRAAMPPPAAVKPVTARSAVVLAAPSAPLPSTPASIAIDAAPPRAKAAPAPALAAAAPPPAFVPRNLAAAPKLSYSAPASKSRFVSVQSVEATRDGRLFVKGAADPNTILHLYLNGSLLAAAAAGADRQWSLTIEHGMSEGDYVLRAEEVDPAGGVLARADAPFTYPQHPSASGPPLRFSAASPQVLPPPPEPVANKPAEAAFKPAPLAVETRPPASVEPVEPHKPIVAASPVVTAFASPPPIPAPAAPGPMIALAPLAAVPGAAGEPVSRPPSVPSEPQAAPPPTLAAAPLESPVPLSEPALSTPPANVVIENVQTTTVVRGDNLWDLARHFYGDGTRFKDLYAANASQIHEPRLIFIGQKFVVPKLATP